MTLFQEIDQPNYSGGFIKAITPGSVADEIQLQVGDELLAINDNIVQDVIDVQYYGAEEKLDLLIRRDGELLIYETDRDYNQALGITFTHPTFDTDIRRCNNLCEFCFVLQMAPRFRRTLYIKDDDYRYSFLFGHYVTLTNLSDHDWWRIETMRLSPLYVSVHVTDLEKRRQFLRNDRAQDIMSQLRRLTDNHIEIHTQLVIVPEINDGQWLTDSIKDLETLWPGVRSITVVPVGLTTHHKYKQRPHSKEEAIEIIDYVESLQPRFREKFGVNFIYLTDEWYLVSGRSLPPLDAYDNQDLRENGLGMVRHFLDEWAEVKTEISRWIKERAGKSDIFESQSDVSIVESESLSMVYKSITFVTGTLFGPILEQTAFEFAKETGIAVDVQHVTNVRLGETITVAGLLMGDEVLAHLASIELGELVLFPRVMFDHPNTITLDDLGPQDMADALGRPVALADTMGDVWDAITRQSNVMFYPGTVIDSDPIQVTPSNCTRV